MEVLKPTIITLCVLALALFMTAHGVAASPGEQALPGEYQVKAAFVYNFLKFVEWPEGALAHDPAISVCVAGELADPAVFEEIRDKDIMGRRLTVAHPASLDQMRGCRVLFIASSEDRRLGRILDALEGSGTLTIGDTSGFAQRGVIINFYIEQNKVRFDINAEAARRAGLKISSRLLKLAGAVYGMSPAKD